MRSAMRSWCGSAAVWFGLAAAACGASRGASAADSPELNAKVAAILKDGWSSPVKSLPLVKEHLEAASALAPSSVRPWYAAAVVHIKHHRQKDAVAALDKAKSLAPDDPFVARAKAWVLLWQKDYPAAIVELERLAELLRVGKQEISPAERVELASFMGRAVVFMEGPGSKQVKAPVVDALKTRITETLPTASLNTFKSALEGATEASLQEALELEQAKADAAAKDAQKKAENLDKLAAEQADAEKKQEELSAARAKVEEIFQDRSAKFENDINTLTPQYQAAGRLVQSINQSVLRTELDINSAAQRANSSKEDRDKNFWNNEAARLQIIRQSQVLEFQRAQAQYAAVEARLSTAVRERDRLRNEYAAAQKQIGAQEGKVGVALKKINRETAKNSQAPTGFNSRTMSQKKISESFPAAEPFPFDRERARVETQAGAAPAAAAEKPAP